MKLAQFLRAKSLWPKRVKPIEKALDEAFVAASNDLAKEQTKKPYLTISKAGLGLIHSFEGIAQLRADGMYEAYPDPGSVNGEPWTIGWGSTGADIGPGTVWTRKQCDERFERDIVRYEQDVREAIGNTPTTQAQFDALVSFHYNTGAIKTATLTKKHNAKDYPEAARQFGRWVFNDGNRMNGLVRRRRAEAEMYRA